MTELKPCCEEKLIDDIKHAITTNRCYFGRTTCCDCEYEEADSCARSSAADIIKRAQALGERTCKDVGVSGNWECSVCHASISDTYYFIDGCWKPGINYCPNCGAKVSDGTD